MPAKLAGYLPLSQPVVPWPLQRQTPKTKPLPHLNRHVQAAHCLAMPRRKQLRQAAAKIAFVLPIPIPQHAWNTHFAAHGDIRQTYGAGRGV
ncbi:MAG: hypothetical protein O7G88_11470, partial [bacterium]|nr:hypothetical protein [bacterium]